MFTWIMLETIGGYSFEAEVVCPTPAAPHFENGFGQRFRSIDTELPFNDWFKNHQAFIRAYIHHWGLLVIDDVQVDNDPQSWLTMRIDPEFHYLPWHSDGIRGEETIMLAHIDSRKPRQAPTLVAPSIQMQSALRQTLLDEASGLYPGTREELKRICCAPDASVDFFEGVYLQFQHANHVEREVFKKLFECSHQLAAPFVYRHTWRANSVLLFDTAHYEMSRNSRGFNRVVHGRMPIAGENINGVQPLRRLV